MSAKVIVLSVWGAPASTAYLKTLQKVPNLQLQVVYEKNEKLEEQVRRIYKERYGDKAPVFEPAPNSVMVDKLQSEETLKVISDLAPDWMILGGSGIVKESLLKIPKKGTLNCHPGILPRYRGCTCVEWAIYEDQPVGATCHFVTSEIDAGDIVLKENLKIALGTNYTELRLQMFHFCAELIAKAVDILVNDPKAAKIEKFDWKQASYYKTIPEDAMARVLQKLEKGTHQGLGGIR